MKAVILSFVIVAMGVVSARAEIAISGFGTGGANPVNVTDDLMGDWQGSGSLTTNALDLTNVSNVATATNGIYSDLTVDGRTPIFIGSETSELKIVGTLVSPPPGIDKFSISLYDTSGSFNELDYTFSWSSFTSAGANGTAVGILTGSSGVFNGTVGSWSLNLFDATGVAPTNVTAELRGLSIVTDFPQITSAASAETTEGEPFSYQITASNSPTGYAADGLPPGLSVDTASGMITGMPTQAGVFSVGVSASNTQGTGTATLMLTVVEALPVLRVVATVPKVTEGTGKTGVFTLTLSKALPYDVIVSYVLKGSARNGTDYQKLKFFKKFKAGKTKKNIQVTPKGNLEGASLKVVKLVVQASQDYTVGTTKPAKVKIYSGH